MFVSGWEKNNKLLISENNYINCPPRFFLAESVWFHCFLTLLFHICRNLHWFLSSAHCFLRDFSGLSFSLLFSNTCFGARPSAKKKVPTPILSTVTRAWLISESVACIPRVLVLGQAWISLPKAGRVGSSWSLQLFWWILVRWRGHPYLECQNIVLISKWLLVYEE